MALPKPRGRRSRILGVFAHPDDETYFAGGTFATYAFDGCDVRLVTLTGGEVFGPARLADYAVACQALGAAGHEHVRPGRWRDLGRAGVPGSLAAAGLADLRETLSAVLERYEPDVVVTNDGDGVTGHPDHIRAHEAVLACRDRFPVLLCGCLRTGDIREAVTALQQLAPGQSIGSGGIGGVSADLLLEHELPLAAGESRAAALDAYHPGLGSAPLTELVDPEEPVGDGVLLRAVMDQAKAREWFRVP